MAAMGLAQIDLSLRADLPPLVTVNGEKLPNVVGLTVRHVPPSMPQLVLELAGEVTLEGEGIVAVERGAGDEIDYMRQFLANLDPDKLDDAAANLFGQEDADGKVITGPGQAFVAAILSMIPKGP
jgi:hypothetical protein